MKTAAKPTRNTTVVDAEDASSVGLRSPLMQKLKPWLFAVASAVLVFIAYSPYPTAYISWVALIPLVMGLNQVADHARRPVLTTLGVFYLFGTLTGGLNTWWIGAAEDLLGSQLLYSSLIFIPLILMVSAYPRVRKRVGEMQAYLFLAAAWVTFDIIQQYFELSTPFLMLGNSFGTTPWAIQWYEFVGAVGGTFWVVMVNILLIVAYDRRSEMGSRVWLRPGLWIVSPLVLSLVMLIPSEDDGRKVSVGMLHARVDQYKEEYALDPLLLVDKYFDVVEEGVDAGSPPELILFPETSLINGGYIEGFASQPVGQRFQERIQALGGKTSVIFGTVAFSVYRGPLERPLPPHIGEFCADGRCSHFLTHNTAVAMSTNGSVEVRGKQRFIPFQEYLPYPSIFENLGDWIVPVGLKAQLSRLERETLIFTRQVPGVQLAPVVCYESLFPNLMADMTEDGATALVVLANENWHPFEWGRKQNIKLLTPRAIETRKTIMRSANHGISAVVSPRGEVLVSTDDDESRMLLSTVNILDSGSTVFTATYKLQYGLWVLFAIMFPVWSIFKPRA